MTDRPEPRPLKGIHHGAFRCRDARQTRWFYEEVLGLKTEGAVVLDTVPGTGADDPYMHIFFRMENGEYIAFFDAPGSARPDSFDRKDSFDLHWAFEVGSEEDLLRMKERISGFGITVHGPLDHHFVRSIYMYDPNGIQIELTRRTDDHDRIFAAERADLDEMIEQWSSRSRAAKEEKFGAEAIDRRARRAVTPEA